MRILVIFLMGIAAALCSNNNSNQVANDTEQAPTTATVAAMDTSDLSKAVVAGGCFWCVEGVYESVIGVEEAVSGYAGGTTENPTYKMVGSGKTDHAEAVLIYYDSTKVDFPTLLNVFAASTDITQVNGQGPDRGRAYRSILFYNNEEEKEIINNKIEAWDNSGEYDKPIAIEVQALGTFWPAEDYHQDFVEHVPYNRGYVENVSIPRIKAFQRAYPELVKPEKNLLK